MKLLEANPVKALALAALLIVFAGSILLAHAGRGQPAEVQPQGSASPTSQAGAAGKTEWMMVPRGSLIDATL